LPPVDDRVGRVLLHDGVGPFEHLVVVRAERLSAGKHFAIGEDDQHVRVEVAEHPVDVALVVGVLHRVAEPREVSDGGIGGAAGLRLLRRGDGRD
jgi:hypothetical protein